jgi:hypothetical protein
MFGLSAASMPAQAPKDDVKDDVPKEPEYKWPEKIKGKTVQTWVADMRGSKDASTREEALRTIPFFGPTATKALGHHLIEAIKLDPDINVRQTAIATVPLVMFDTPLMDEGFTTLINILKDRTQPSQTRGAAAAALGGCGWTKEAKKAVPTLLAITLVDPNSWQNRKAAVTALGSLGQPLMKSDGKPEDGGPNIEVVKALSRLLYQEKKDPSHLVRREAITSLLLLGPPLDAAVLKLERDALKETYTYDVTHRSVGIWARVAYIRTELKLIGPSDPNLLYIANVIPSSDKKIKHEKKIEDDIKATGNHESKTRSWRSSKKPSTRCRPRFRPGKKPWRPSRKRCRPWRISVKKPFRDSTI